MRAVTSGGEFSFDFARGNIKTPNPMGPSSEGTGYHEAPNNKIYPELILGCWVSQGRAYIAGYNT